MCQLFATGIAGDRTGIKYNGNGSAERKHELKKAIVDNYKKLTNKFANIPVHLTYKKELEGHAKNMLMSIKNLVAYLVGWGHFSERYN